VQSCIAPSNLSHFVIAITCEISNFTYGRYSVYSEVVIVIVVIFDVIRRLVDIVIFAAQRAELMKLRSASILLNTSIRLLAIPCTQNIICGSTVVHQLHTWYNLAKNTPKISSGPKCIVITPISMLFGCRMVSPIYRHKNLPPIYSIVSKRLFCVFTFCTTTNM
jgi:hypothetical protein